MRNGCVLLSETISHFFIPNFFLVPIHRTTRIASLIPFQSIGQHTGVSTNTEVIGSKGTEYQATAHIETSGNLTRWANQGVLLLNATLTVRAHQAGSHQRQGWEEFTDAAIRVLAEQRENIVFILWGSYAQKKGAFIDRNKHLVLASAHPSPLSAYNGFFGNKHFSRTNEYLQAHGQTPIEW